jgi:hypothetical protein
MKREAARASDAEIEALQPIIADLVDLLDPHVIAKAYRAGRSTGATVRLLVIPEVDVDVIALARYVRARTGDVRTITPGDEAKALCAEGPREAHQ